MASGIADVRDTEGDDEEEDQGARELREPSPELSAEFEVIFRREYPAAVTLARRYVKASDAEDVVQTVFTKFWDGYAETPALVFSADAARTHAAILTAVRNEVGKLNRRAEMLTRTAVYVCQLFGQIARQALAPERRPEEVELAEVVARAINLLPRRQREVFCLVKFDEKSYAEAAEILHISPGTVHQHLVKGNIKLRQLLEGYDMPDPTWSYEPDDDESEESDTDE